MTLQTTETVTTLKTQAIKVSEYKKNPGSINNAVYAAWYYAKRNKETMVVIEGNSYMNRIYSIARVTDRLAYYTASNKTATVVVVTEKGEVTKAIAQ